VIIGFDGGEFDAEGRYVEARFDTARRKFSVISCYFPSGSSGEERQAGQVPLPGRMYPHLMR
jgi:exodeoxyribonuclease-3